MRIPTWKRVSPRHGENCVQQEALRLWAQSKMDITGSAATDVPLADSQNKEEEEWALRETKKAKAFSEKQRKFLEEKFMVGVTTGRKLDPVTVARQMKIARDVDGQRQFSHYEVLSCTQIQSFFSRRAKCKSSEDQLVSDKDYEAAENEEALATLRNEVLERIQPKHPVMYDSYNICDLVTSQKLNKLKISKLSEICRSFKLEVPAQQGKRKAPFVGALTAMVSECSCDNSATSSVSPWNKSCIIIVITCKTTCFWVCKTLFFSLRVNFCCGWILLQSRQPDDPRPSLHPIPAEPSKNV